MNYIGKSGENYTLGTQLGKGGEGIVFDIQGMSDNVAKIYHDDKRTEARHRKLLAMLDVPLSDHAKGMIAWPIDVLYENGKFAGFIMPRVNRSASLDEVYTMHGTYAHFTLKEKITVAMNLCAAIDALHDVKQTCGDFNPQNISVDFEKGRVTLVDADSFHITDNTGQLYRCEVGKSDYLSPELQKRLINGATLINMQAPTFTQATDNFSLAVHIFALLMNGVHPFTTRKLVSGNSVSVPQPIDNIKNGKCPYFTQHTGLGTSLFSPELASLPPDVQNLFEKAFVNGFKTPSKRPEAEVWHPALVSYLKNLKRCTKDKNHYYYNKLKACPWCELELKIKSGLSAIGNGPGPAITPINQININAPTPPASVLAPPYGGVTSSAPLTRRRSLILGALAILVIIIISVIAINNQPASYEASDIAQEQHEVVSSGASEIEENDSVRTANIIKFDTMATGYLSQGYKDNNIDDEYHDVDIYMFSAYTNGLAEVVFETAEMSTDEYYWRVEVADNTGDVLASEQVKGKTTSTVIPFVANASRTYYLKIDSGSDYWTAGAYGIAVKYANIEPEIFEKESNGTYKKATKIKLAKIVEGALSEDFYNEADWYRFTLKNPKRISLEIFTTPTDSNKAFWNFRLYNAKEASKGGSSDNVVFSQFIDGKTPYFQSEEIELKAGKYYVRVESSEDWSSAPYRFRVSGK